MTAEVTIMHTIVRMFILIVHFEFFLMQIMHFLLNRCLTDSPGKTIVIAVREVGAPSETRIVSSQGPEPFVSWRIAVSGRRMMVYPELQRMKPVKASIFLILLCFAVLIAGNAAAAGDSGTESSQKSDHAESLLLQRMAHLETQVAEARSAADNSWILISSALVLMMTGPGLALFYGGLVRRKNVLATMMQSFTMIALVTVIWAVIGYSLAFHEGSPVVGGVGYAFLKGVGLEADPGYAPTIPQLSFMVFQLMFAIITPGLITGAFAERMKFSGMLLLMTLWTLLVYAPMAHMVWGKGGLLNAALGGPVPALDFAGGTVVHITSGVSALVCALYLGRRHGYPREPILPHSVVLSFIGACLLWVGWFGFNAGSALAAGSLATSAFVATHFGAAAATVSWVVAEWIRDGKPSALGAISGSVAGLVAITPASGFVSPMSALVIGLVAGAVCYVMVARVKKAFGYDDSLDAFGVHGAGGTVGALLTGIFATRSINAIFNDNPVGLVDGNAMQVVNQLVGVVIAWVLALAGTFLILKVVDAVVGLRVSEENEIQGLDLSIHGEEGYNM
jgi:Amt family ammonium transporter